MTIQRQEIKDRLDSSPHSKTIVDLDEIIEKWVSSNRRHVASRKEKREKRIEQVTAGVYSLI